MKDNKSGSSNLYIKWKERLLNRPLVVIVLFIFVTIVGILQLTRGIIDVIPRRQKGELQISAIKVKPNRITNSTLIEFYTVNKGNSIILIHEIRFELIDIVTGSIGGYLPSSHNYQLDISNLVKIGHTRIIDVSQEINPRESDRFSVTIIAKELPEGIERGWRLLPILTSNYGNTIGDTLEIWFPEDGQSAEPKYFEILKKSLFNKLVGAPDLSKVNDVLKQIRFSNEPDKEYDSILNSKYFVQQTIDKIAKESDLKIITNFLATIRDYNIGYATKFLRYRDFYLTILPIKLDEELDVANIGYCIEVLAGFRHIDSSENWFDPIKWIFDRTRPLFDAEKFVKKINNESNVVKIRRCFKGIVNSSFLVNHISESELLDKEMLIQKLNDESDTQEALNCLAEIGVVSEDLEKYIYKSLNINLQKKYTNPSLREIRRLLDSLHVKLERENEKTKELIILKERIDNLLSNFNTDYPRDSLSPIEQELINDIEQIRNDASVEIEKRIAG